MHMDHVINVAIMQNKIAFLPPSTSLPRGYATIHKAEIDFINWLQDTGLEV